MKRFWGEPSHQQDKEQGWGASKAGSKGRGKKQIHCSTTESLRPGVSSQRDNPKALLLAVTACLQPRMKVRMTAVDTFHTGHCYVSGNLGFVADSSDVFADSIDFVADCPVFVAVFMTVGLLAVPDALLTSLSGRNLHGVPSRDSNSGLPYSKPARYQLSHAAP